MSPALTASRRVFDEGVRQRGHVHQSVLVYADVDKRAERRHVGDAAFENHAGLQILHVFYALGKTGRDEFGARIAAGFFQLFQDVAHGRQGQSVHR